MEEFKGLVTDTLLTKNPQGTWQNAKNIVLTKGIRSIANEDGLKFDYLVPGIIIGRIVTNTDIVYCIKNKDSIDEIGVVNRNNNIAEYTTVVKSNLFNFNISCPIEGIFIYNFKKELTVAFCDGVFDKSNNPKIVNINNIGIELDSNKSLVNAREFNKLKLFPNVKEANVDLSYLDSGAIAGLAAYVTYCYVFVDGSTSPYFSTSAVAYLASSVDPVDKKGLRLTFKNLDINFDKLKIGLVTKDGEALKGYESYVINYKGTEKQIDITSLSNFTITAPDAIILEKQTFEKIQSITKADDQIIVGRTKTKDVLQFQKYANLLKLRPVQYTDDNEQTPSLLPDEVYSIYIQPQWLDGSYTETAFHIPGDIADSKELQPLSNEEKQNYNLRWTDDLNVDIKRFHVFNTGETIYSDISPNAYMNKFGIWYNEEKYPDTDDYNSLIDYKGKPIITTPQDLRGTPVRYHRVPAIDKNVLFGNEDTYLNSNNLENKKFSKIGIQVANLNSVIPKEVKDKLQGYRILFVKRNGGNNYVAGNWIGTRLGELDWTQANVPITWKFYDFNVNELSDEYYTVKRLPGSNNNYVVPNEIDFDNMRVISNELFKFKPNLDITYIKNNYLFTVDENRGIKLPTNLNKFAKVKNNLKYVLSNNLAADTQYFENGIDLLLDTEDFNKMTLTGSSSTDAAYGRYYAMNMTAFAFKSNLYSGFKSNSLVVMGKINTANPVELIKGGDVFNNNVIDVNVHTAKQHTFDSNRDVIFQYATVIKAKGLFSPLNSSKLTNRLSDQEAEYTIGDNDRAYRIPGDYLNSRDYDLNTIDENDLNLINDINTVLSFDYNANYINDFPFRVNKGIKIPNESISSGSLRTFLTNSYYELPNDKGEIIAVRGISRKLFIQCRFTLFIAAIKDTLRTLNSDAYLGETDIFDRKPSEILDDDKGHVGSISKHSCTIIKGMYICINAPTGQIFIIVDSYKEISEQDNKNWFFNNWDIGLDYYRTENGERRRIDNPYCSIGYLVGFDREYDRLIFTKKMYNFKFKDLVGKGVYTFDGEFYYNKNKIIDFNNEQYFTNVSYTLSYDYRRNAWICPHDYFPNSLFYTPSDLYSFVNNLEKKEAMIYKHNDKSTKGLYYGKKFPSYVDLIFNQNLKVTKALHSVTWIIDTINKIGGNEQFNGITGIMVYNNNQCSGIINLRDEYETLTRNVHGEWNFNNFQDLVINPSDPILNKDGSVNQNNLNELKLWFERSDFISKFIVVRLIVDNIDNNEVYIHDVTTNSVINNR